jgi:hypothetical protein
VCSSDLAAASAAAGPFPTRDELTLAWGDHVLAQLSPRARARYRAGRFATVDGEVAVFALPDPFHRDRCVECQAEVEQALAAHFGRPVRLRLEVDTGARHTLSPEPPASPPQPPAPAPEEEPVAWEELTDAPPGAVPSPLEQVMQAFQGAEVVED